jgi:hypothetical protein
MITSLRLLTRRPRSLRGPPGSAAPPAAPARGCSAGTVRSLSRVFWQRRYIDGQASSPASLDESAIARRTSPTFPSARDCCHTQVTARTLMPEQSGGAGERRDQPTDLGSAPYPHRSPIGAALDKGNRSIGPLTPPPSSNLHHCPRTAEVRGSSPRRSRAPCGRPHGGPSPSHRGSPPLAGAAKPRSPHPATWASRRESSLGAGCGQRADAAGPLPSDSSGLHLNTTPAPWPHPGATRQGNTVLRGRWPGSHGRSGDIGGAQVYRPMAGLQLSGAWTPPVALTVKPTSPLRLPSPGGARISVLHPSHVTGRAASRVRRAPLRPPRSAVGGVVDGGPPPTRYRPRRQAWLGRREQAEQRRARDAVRRLR